MSENLRDEFARALMDSWRSWPSHPVAFKYTFAAMADAELDRLRAEVEDQVRQVRTYHDRAMASEAAEGKALAEVERWKRRERIAVDQRDVALRRAESAGIRERDERRARDRALMRNATLRARLAAVEALLKAWDEIPDHTPSHYDRGRVDQRHRAAEELATALASVPEPSEPAADGGAGGQQTVGEAVMPTQLREATRVARKPYRCSMCNGAIEVGTSHHVSTNLWDGRVYDWRTCTACAEDNICGEVYWWAGYPDEGVDYESAWEWAHEHRDDPALGREARAFMARCACKCERCAPEDGVS